MKKSFVRKACALLACASFLGAMPCAAQTESNPSAVGVPDLSAYILTPKPAATPRINGAKVFGLRPNSKCLYTVAATATVR